VEGKEHGKPALQEAHGVEVACAGRPPLGERVRRVTLPVVTSGVLLVSLPAAAALLVHGIPGLEELATGVGLWLLGVAVWVLALWPYAMTWVLADHRGRSPQLWFLFSLILNPWLTVGLLALLPDLGDPLRLPPSRTRKIYG